MIPSLSALYAHSPSSLFNLKMYLMQGIINGFTKEDGLSHTQDNKEELRTDAEQNVAKFIEVAKQMETFFLQRRLQLSVLKPEQLIKEVILIHHGIVKTRMLTTCWQDCSELKQELARKDELIKKHYEKISIWLNMLGDPQTGPVSNGAPAIGEGGPQQAAPPQQQQSNMMPFQHR